MADGTSIEWARHPVTGKGASWNPLLARVLETGKVGYHCEHVSSGCEHCYAEAFNLRRLPARGTGLEFKPGHRGRIEIFIEEKQLRLPLQWRDPRGIFVCSMSDLFGSFVTDAMIDRMMAVMALAPQHVFMVLTKRSERMNQYLSDPETPRRIYELVCDMVVVDGARAILIAPGIDPALAPPGPRVFLGQWPLKNLWIGVSVEDQRYAYARIPDLIATPASRRFLSMEPLLEHVDLSPFGLDPLYQPGGATASPELQGLVRRARNASPDGRLLHWVIAGFESGTNARAIADAPDIARSLRDQCIASNVDFLFKQWGAWAFAPEGMNYNEAFTWATIKRYSLSRPTQGWGGMGGIPSRFEQFSNGRSAFYVGKKDAGRELDGRTHDGMPELAP